MSVIDDVVRAGAERINNALERWFKCVPITVTALGANGAVTVRIDGSTDSVSAVLLSGQAAKVGTRGYALWHPGRVNPLVITISDVDSGSLAAARLSFPGSVTVATLSTFVRFGAFTTTESAGNVSVNSGAGIVTIKKDGWYSIAASVRCDTSTSGRRLAAIYINNVERVRMGDFNQAATSSFAATHIVHLLPEDTVAFYVWNNVSSTWTNGQLSVAQLAGITV